MQATTQTHWLTTDNDIERLRAKITEAYRLAGETHRRHTLKRANLLGIAALDEARLAELLEAELEPWELEAEAYAFEDAAAAEVAAERALEGWGGEGR